MDSGKTSSHQWRPPAWGAPWPSGASSQSSTSKSPFLLSGSTLRSLLTESCMGRTGGRVDCCHQHFLKSLLWLEDGRLNQLNFCFASLSNLCWWHGLAAYDDVISIATTDCFSSGQSLVAVFKAQGGWKLTSRYNNYQKVFLLFIPSGKSH